VRLALMAKALKRRQQMLTRELLEKLLAAWPDENGTSRNPELYNAWLERTRRYDARIIQNALGRERILALTDKQKALLEKSYQKLLSEKDITDVSDAEILGRYELITEHISLSVTEEIVAAYRERRRFH
jgi:hypothetical protein